MFSPPGSPTNKINIPKSHIKLKNSMNLFSPKNRQHTGINSNKLNSYISNIPSSSIKKSEPVDLNHTTRVHNKNGNLPNSRILSPISRPKFPKSPIHTPIHNKNRETRKPRRYVANVAERDLFRTTFINQRDISETRNDSTKEPMENITSFRRRDL